MADGDPIEPPLGGEPPTVITGDGDGAESRFPITVDYRHRDDIKVQVKESGTWTRKTRGTHYEIIGNVVVFNSGHIPASGTGNVEIWAQVPRSVKELRPPASLHPASYIIQELQGWILPYPWVFNSRGSAGSTSENFRFGETPMDICPFPVPFDVTCQQVAICTSHDDSSSPPASWTVSITINGASAATTSFAAGFDATAATPKVTTTVWDGKFDLDAGDYFALDWAGSAVDFPYATLMLLYRLRTPA